MTFLPKEAMRDLGLLQSLVEGIVDSLSLACQELWPPLSLSRETDMQAPFFPALQTRETLAHSAMGQRPQSVTMGEIPGYAGCLNSA